MSIDYGIYVGPYVRCAVKQEPRTQLQITCLNMLCANHGEGQRTPFCSLCGGKVGTVPHVELADAVDHWDVSEQIDQRLSTATGDTYWEWTQAEHAHIWMPNVGDVGQRLNNRESWKMTPIVPEQIEIELAQLHTEFADDLALFADVYGADAITLHWGIIQDYS